MSTTSKPRGTIARICNGPCSELRVLLSTWKGETKIEFAEHSCLIAGADIYFQSGPSVTLPIEKIDKLIEALDVAKKRGVG